LKRRKRGGGSEYERHSLRGKEFLRICDHIESTAIVQSGLAKEVFRGGKERKEVRKSGGIL